MQMHCIGWLLSHHVARCVASTKLVVLILLYILFFVYIYIFILYITYMFFLICIGQLPVMVVVMASYLIQLRSSKFFKTFSNLFKHQHDIFLWVWFGWRKASQCFSNVDLVIAKKTNIIESVFFRGTMMLFANSMLCKWSFGLCIQLQCRELWQLLPKWMTSV